MSAMPDGNSAAELNREDFPRQTAFDAWYVERLRQLRNEPSELAIAFTSNDDLAEIGAVFLRIGVRASHEGMDDWRLRKAAQWSGLWHAMVDRVMLREQKEWK